MNLWQPLAANKMSDFLNEFLPVKEIAFTGSLLEPTTLDIFSDVDIKILLSENSSLSMKNLVKMLSERFDKVFGFEVHNHDNSDVLRVCFENGWRFDLTFNPRLQESQEADISFYEKTDKTINFGSSLYAF